jgi:prolyl-tRNA editing enzyme YbaK/EbsC (Cys-tRNA(Pro) deacylase)
MAKSTMVAAAATGTATLEELESRVDALERMHYGKILIAANDAVAIPTAAAAVDAVGSDDSVRRAVRAVQALGVYSARCRLVPPPYYSWSLERRAACLGTKPTAAAAAKAIVSPQSLCKSLLMENKKWAPSHAGDCAADKNNDPTNPRYVLVVIQYAATLDVKKLTTAVRALRTDATGRLDASQLEFRIASAQDNSEITGYRHNSVSPFGMVVRTVPIVIASAIAPHKFFWCGGGHENLKLGVAFSEFCRALNPIVADISEPRSDFAVILDD